jgi:hypothetical protein
METPVRLKPDYTLVNPPTKKRQTSGPYDFTDVLTLKKPLTTADQKRVADLARRLVKLAVRDLSVLERVWNRDTTSLRHHISVAMSTVRERIRIWIFDIARNEGKFSDEPVVTLKELRVAEGPTQENPTDWIMKRMERRFKEVLREGLPGPESTQQKYWSSRDAVIALQASDLAIDGIKSKLGVEEAIVPAEETAIL